MKLTKAGKVGLVFVILVILLVVLFIFLIIKEPAKKVSYLNIKKDDNRIILDGDFVTYVNLNNDYAEPGYKAYEGNKDVTKSVAVTYFDEDGQVLNIDTSKDGSYTVRYEALMNGKIVSAQRVVIVSDNKKPDITFPKKTVINSLDVYNYDIYDGVIVKDNSGEVDYECKSNLKTLPGEYLVKCKASDKSGNKRMRNRIIKVEPAIVFDYKNSLKITYPEGDFEYKYSLDNGATWNEAQRVTILNNRGNIIAGVFKNGEFLYSSTYFVK